MTFDFRAVLWNLAPSITVGFALVLLAGCGGDDDGGSSDGGPSDGGSSPDGRVDADGAPPVQDECALEIDDCFDGVECRDLPAGYECGPCPAGLIGDGRTCAAPGSVGLASDGDSTCIVGSDQKIRCWGVNRSGQLGDGTQMGRLAPVAVGGDPSWVQVSTADFVGGSGHTCGRTAEGGVYCWGGAEYFPSFYQPTPYAIGTDTDWTDVSASHQAACGIRGGAIYCWGRFFDGTRSPTPRQLGTDSDWVDVIKGDVGGCAIKSDTTLWCWGKAVSHADGVGAGSDRVLDQWTQVNGLDAWPELCGIRSGGSLYCGNAEGELVRVGEDSDWVQVEVHGTQRCGLRRDGSVSCWSSPLSHIVVDPTMAQPIALPEAAIAIAVGRRHVCAATGTERVFCWGENDLGQLGYGQRENQGTPLRIGTETYRTVATSQHGSCAAHADGRLLCWGANMYPEPQLPINGTASWGSIALVPHPIDESPDWEALSSGGAHDCGIRAGGELHCWGSGHGVLGLGEAMGFVTVPTRVGAESNWTTVVATDLHTCGIRNRELYCWGDGAEGQTGDPALPDVVWTPARVGLESDWTDVAVARDRTCAIRAGRIHCFGRDPLSRTASGVPTAVALDGWTDVSISAGHACGLRSETLYCWGSLTAGGLRTGLAMDAPAPVMFSPETGWTAVEVGDGLGCGLRGGDLYCWGGGHPLSTTGDEVPDPPILTPTRVGTRSDWAELSVSATHVCARDDAGGAYCWGDGNLGRLGHGHAFRMEPTEVAF